MNFGTPVPLLIGIILILGALALFFLEKFRPGYERDADKVYAVLLLVSGLFLLAHLDMELLASFQQLLMAGMLTTLLIESIRSREPRENILREPLNDRRPPRPRYDERPPVRRGYRAELDDRPDLRPELRDRTSQPRMNPANAPYPQATYPQEAYANGRVRPPYEEYRGPAGRLQPSRPSGPSSEPNYSSGPNNAPYGVGAPPDNRYSDNSRYGERPPAPQRPPQQQSGRPPESFRRPEGSVPPDDRSRPDARPDARPETRHLDGQRGDRPSRPTDSGPRSNSPRNGAEGSESPTRTLNIRPLSEAPKFDPEAPKFDEDYRPDNNQSRNPESAPSEY